MSTQTLRQLTRYKRWANENIYRAVGELPEDEALRVRKTRFGNMVHTLNHVYVIDSIFQAHLLGKPHRFTARNTPTHPPLAQLNQQVVLLDQWYIDYVDTLQGEDVDQVVNFEFIGGGRGAMTRSEMILHVVNHGSYHRGFVGDMMYQADVTPPATDFPVFVRDVAPLAD